MLGMLARKVVHPRAGDVGLQDGSTTGLGLLTCKMAHHRSGQGIVQLCTLPEQPHVANCPYSHHGLVVCHLFMTTREPTAPQPELT